jgi:TRAP-type uncharacterized transport system fused permease subunit
MAFSALQIATTGHLIDLPGQVVRAVHVGFLGLPGFPLLALARRRTGAIRAAAWVLAAASVAVATYQWVNCSDLLFRPAIRPPPTACRA